MSYRDDHDDLDRPADAGGGYAVDRPSGEGQGARPAPNVPLDLRDTHTELGVGDATETPEPFEAEGPTIGIPYPAPEVVERPHVPETSATIPATPLVDTSLSRPADRLAAGLDPEAYGYGPPEPPAPVEPLGPKAAEGEGPDAGPEPAGQYGSSG